MEKEKAPEKEQKDKRLSLRLSHELEEKIRKESKRKGLTINEWLLQVIRKNIDLI